MNSVSFPKPAVEQYEAVDDNAQQVGGPLVVHGTRAKHRTAPTRV